MSNRLDAKEVVTALHGAIEPFTTALIGKLPSYRHGDEIRYGSKSALAINTRGPKVGIWFDHSAGVGGDLIDLVRHVGGFSFLDALSFCASWSGQGGASYPPQSAPMRRAKVEMPKATTVSARVTWCEAVDPEGTPVETYLASRGLALPQSCDRIRFHPACRRGAERLPTMVALMTDPLTDKPVGVHRTFLQNDGSGKADGQAKMMLGQAGVIRLDEGEIRCRLGIAEGIETALSLAQRVGWAPMWAVGSAGGISRFPVNPYSGLHLTIFPDNDDSGASLNAAHACANRWVEAGRTVTIEIPPAGKDWADVARAVA